MEDTHLNDDVLTEVLSELSAKSLAANKCVSKRWNSLISSRSFLQLHSKRTDGVSGLFFQRNLDHVSNLDFSYGRVAYIPLGEEKSEMQETFLDFLPQKVALMASCNGLLCCRSSGPTKDSTQPKDLVIYICNPTTKEYIALTPIGCHVTDSFGFAFYPFGSSSNTDASFKLVSIQHPKLKSNLYSFVIFSSETGKWTISKEVCYWGSKIHNNMQIFVSGRFHWLTRNHHIITFDVESELSGVIKLPGPIMEGKGDSGMRLGCSGKSLIYVCVHSSKVRVWMLKDYHKAEWVLRNHLDLLEFSIEHVKLLNSCVFRSFDAQRDNAETMCSKALVPLAFYEEALFMHLDRKLYSYSFKTGKLERHCYVPRMDLRIATKPLTVLPYSVNLAAMNFLRDNGAEPKGSPSAASQKTQKRKRRIVKTTT